MLERSDDIHSNVRVSSDCCVACLRRRAVEAEKKLAQVRKAVETCTSRNEFGDLVVSHWAVTRALKGKKT